MLNAMDVSWGEFGALYAAALAGALALIPYTLRLVRASSRPMKVSPRTVVLASLAQNALLFAIVVFVGLAVSHAVGLGAPYVASFVGCHPPPRPLGPVMSVATVIGAGAGLFLTVADLVLLPRLPALLDLARKSSLWESFSASFYGGVNEELLMRLLGVSSLVWLVSQGWRSGPPPTPAVFWLAIVAMAILFALGHLPATKAVAGKITPLILTRSLALNGPIAILCGWLFWRYGVEAAIVAHLTADLVYHVGGTALLHANDRRRFLSWFPPAPSISQE
jgi:hypothetical protein